MEELRIWLSAWACCHGVRVSEGAAPSVRAVKWIIYIGAG